MSRRREDRDGRGLAAARADAGLGPWIADGARARFDACKARSRELLRQSLDPRRQVDGVTDRRELAPRHGAGAADHGAAGVEAAPISSGARPRAPRATVKRSTSASISSAQAVARDACARLPSRSAPLRRACRPRVPTPLAPARPSRRRHRAAPRWKPDDADGRARRAADRLTRSHSGLRCVGGRPDSRRRAAGPRRKNMMGPRSAASTGWWR
jgi:hypothetical protein